jgi:hypothetical protein
MLLVLRPRNLEETPMEGKFTRRHLFARLGALLAGLWACRRAPATTARATPAVLPSPQRTIVSTCSYDSSQDAIVSTSTYDWCGRLIEERHGSPPPSRLSTLPPWPRKRHGRKQGNADISPDDEC